jgi:2,3-bisphosphoglycerate-independent phosphoglycerate mutase
MVEKACLIVIDGWGVSTEQDAAGDAIRNANTPIMRDLTKRFQSTPLTAHGLSVGLPDALMGNSEVGHLNIGAGRVVYQDIVRIDLFLNSDKIEKKRFNFDKTKDLHLIGLVSDGGVHSHINHLLKLILLAKNEVKNTHIHVLADGRDTPPKSIKTYLKTLQV